MIGGDYATKPLQGALFRKCRDQILGVVLAQADPGPGKTDHNVGKSETAKNEPTKGQAGKERHHRSVLGVVKRAKDAQTRTKEVRPCRREELIRISEALRDFTSLLLNNLVLDNGSIRLLRLS
jgi:hypothetical protein